ncbi:MAG TPA: class F sortase [Acidimicrobiales bacterium]|nr:class F sortase [Acidimicrobiales bacterium]
MRVERTAIRSSRYAVAIVALATIATGVTLGIASRSPATSRPPLTATSIARPVALVPHVARQRLITVARSLPVKVIIPSLGVVARVVELGLMADRQVQVPTTTTVAGWYKLGPTPGQLGSSVLLGHVDSYTGPGIFFRLRDLVAGQSVEVLLANGVTTHFVVERVVQYSKNNFPDRLVYGNHGTQSLNLVTCGGAFDHATGHYEANVVVFTRLVSLSR